MATPREEASLFLFILQSMPTGALSGLAGHWASVAMDAHSLTGLDAPLISHNTCVLEVGPSLERTLISSQFLVEC